MGTVLPQSLFLDDMAVGGILCPNGVPLALQENLMLPRRYLWAVLTSFFGTIALAMALTQILYPVTALTETSGTVVALQSAPDTQPSNQSSHIAVRFVTQRGEAVVVSDQIAADRSVRLGDHLPVTYFPWAPEDGRIGPIAQSVSLAIGVQWVVVAVCGVLGLAGCIVSTRMLRLARHHQLYLIGLYFGIVLLLVALPIMPRPSPAM